MATLIPNQFSSYELSPGELRAATNFSELQRQFLQNEISIAAQERLALKFDPQDPLRFAQQEAELAGKIGILQYILSAYELYSQPAVNQPSDSEN